MKTKWKAIVSWLRLLWTRFALRKTEAPKKPEASMMDHLPPVRVELESPPIEFPPKWTLKGSISDLKPLRLKTLPKGQDFDQAAQIAKKMTGVHVYVNYEDGSKDLVFQSYVPSGVFVEPDPWNDYDVGIRLTAIGDKSLWEKP